METKLNASADFFSVGATIRMHVDLSALPVEDRRAIFNALLLDTELNPGSAKMSHEERKSALAWINKWCAWPSSRS